MHPGAGGIEALSGPPELSALSFSERGDNAEVVVPQRLNEPRMRLVEIGDTRPSALPVNASYRLHLAWREGKS